MWWNDFKFVWVAFAKKKAGEKMMIGDVFSQQYGTRSLRLPSSDC